MAYQITLSIIALNISGTNIINKVQNFGDRMKTMFQL